MGKKNLNNLVSNILSSPEPGATVQAPGVQPAKKVELEGDTNATFCGRASVVKLAKIRQVANEHNIPITDLYNLAFGMFIDQYEAKYGSIVYVEDKKEKGDVNSLL